VRVGDFGVEIPNRYFIWKSDREIGRLDETRVAPAQFKIHVPLPGCSERGCGARRPRRSSSLPNVEPQRLETSITHFRAPIINGKDLVQDPAAAVRFDKAEVKRRIAMVRGFAKDAGREADAVEISGIVLLSLARSKSEADAGIRTTATGMGFAGEEAARNSPLTRG
jgi:hypothetical protein